MKRKRICIKYIEKWRKQPGNVECWCYHALETELSDCLALLSVCSGLKFSLVQSSEVRRFSCFASNLFMSSCRMGKSSYNRGNQAMAPGEQNARVGVHVFFLVNFRFFIVFSLFVCFFESCRCICSSPNVNLSLGSIKCPSSPRHPPDALLKVTAQHRRARSAAWSYRFPLNEEWCDLVISLPTAILLHEVHIQPHTTGLSSKCWPWFRLQGLCNKFV